jgi:hypothetical protein
MNARPVIALALLLTFPASTLAQTRLDLRSIKVVADEPESKPVSLPTWKVRPPDYQQVALTGPEKKSCVESEARGRTDADARGLHKDGSGAASGTTAAFGFFGFLTPAVATAFKPKPKTVPADLDPACYAQGYGTKGRHEHAHDALWGMSSAWPHGS